MTTNNWQQYGMQPVTLGMPATPVFNADLRAPSTPVPKGPQQPVAEVRGGGFVYVKPEIEFNAEDLIEVASSPECLDSNEVQQNAQTDNGFSESSESSCEESSSEEEEPEETTMARSSHESSIQLPDSGWYINSNSLVLHCLRDANKFRCGRTLNVQYIRVRELNGFRCGRCFNV